MRISQEARWEQNYAAIQQFIEKNKCLPSKHRVEEHKMLNWLKYNKKLIGQGKLSPERQEKLELLLTGASGYRKLNQYSYVSGKAVLTKKTAKKETQELSLF